MELLRLRRELKELPNLVRHMRKVPGDQRDLLIAMIETMAGLWRHLLTALTTASSVRPGTLRMLHSNAHRRRSFVKRTAASIGGATWQKRVSAYSSRRGVVCR